LGNKDGGMFARIGENKITLAGKKKEKGHQLIK
jgi:hypothetical protein